MDKNQLLFYDAYEDFYKMAEHSNAFRSFCADAFGEDFSQDGFSDISQIDMILKYIPNKSDTHILDIGCGNGKMLGYLQQRTGAFIHGFDYSRCAIETAQKLFPINSEFKEGIIGKAEYPECFFDVVISMDTIYFCENLYSLVNQIIRWLKPGGFCFVGYQEGDVYPKTSSVHKAELTKVLAYYNLNYQVFDITEQTFFLLKNKRNSAIKHQLEFEAEGYREWFDLLMMQTECATEPYTVFKEKMSRYIYVIRKEL